MENFKYAPLLPFSERGNPSIRLVELQPRAARYTQPLHTSSTPDLIVANLVDAHLGEGESYETLSYCWGDDKIKHPISLNGLNFLVTINLHAALHRLQKDDGIRRIWIDAICVDQCNIDERNQQVRLMRQVYSFCERCLVWLGEFDGDVSMGVKVISTIESLRDAMAEMDDPSEDLLELSFEDKGLMLEALGLSGHEQWASLDRIINAPWFRRVWVIQEITFPPIVTVLCGDAELDWDQTVATMDFGRQIGLLSSSPNPLNIVRKGNYHSFQQLGGMRMKGKEEHLMQILLRFRGSGATDKRDNIFALMGLQERSRRENHYPRSSPQFKGLLEPEVGPSPKKLSFGSLMDRRRDKLLSAVAFFRKIDPSKRIEFLKIEQELGIIAEDIKRKAGNQLNIPKDETSDERSRRREVAAAAVDNPEHLLALLHRSAELAESINMNDGVESLSREETLERILASDSIPDLASLDWEQFGAATPQDDLLEPDYNLADTEVYTIMMDKLLCTSRDLGLLTFIDPLPFQRQEGSSEEMTSFTSRLPSWVIDWSIKMDTIPLLGRFCASLKLQHLMLPGEIDGRLVVQGHQFDAITHVPPVPPQSSWAALFSNLASWKSLAHTQYLKGCNPEEDEINKVFCHTVMGGLLARKMRGIEYELEDVESLLTLVEKSERPIGTVTDLYINRRVGKESQIMTNLINICTKRKLVILATGRMGLVPENAEIGDKLFLLKGSDVPFILREDGEGSWRLGGHCYVHGVMFGEAFEKDGCREIVLV